MGVPTQWRGLTRLIGPVYLPNIAGTIAWGMLIPTLPLYLSDRGVSIEMVGLILGGAGLGALFGGLPAGSLMTRLGEERTVVIGLAGLALSTALLGATDAAVALLLLRMLFGSSSLATRASLQTWVTKNVELDIRGRAMALFGGSSRVSQLIGPAIGGVLADTVGFSATFVVAAVLSLAGIIPAVAAHRGTDIRAGKAAEPARRSLLQSIRTHWRLLLKAALVPFLAMMIREARHVLLPLVGDDLQMSATAIGLIVALGSAADLVLFPVAGTLMDRFGRLSSMVPAFLLVGLGMLLLSFAASASSTGFVIAAGVLLGVGNGLSAGSMLTLGADLAPRADAASFLATLATLQESGRFAGAFGVGLAAGAASLAVASLLFAGVAVMLVVTMVRLVGETRDVAAD